jgi:hypothetical protein
MIRQNIEWLACPPPLFLTAVRMSSGTDSISARSSSTLPLSASGCSFEGRVEVGYVGVVVFLAVEVHSLFVYVRLQGVVVVGK